MRSDQALCAGLVAGTRLLKPSMRRHGVSLLGLPSDTLRQLAAIETPCGDRAEPGLSARDTVLLLLAAVVPLGLWMAVA